VDDADARPVPRRVVVVRRRARVETTVVAVTARVVVVVIVVVRAAKRRHASRRDSTSPGVDASDKSRHVVLFEDVSVTAPRDDDGTARRRDRAFERDKERAIMVNSPTGCCCFTCGACAMTTGRSMTTTAQRHHGGHRAHSD